MGKPLSLLLAMTACLTSQAQTKAPNDAELNAATQKIYERLCETQVTENRGDTLFYESPECGTGRPCGALLLDALQPLQSHHNSLLGVFRIFSVTNDPRFTQDTAHWEALTYLGTGRGYQVQFGLAYFDVTELGLELTHLDLDVGFLGEGFHLPDWTVHEFNDGKEPWGAMVFENHSWRMGFGHSTISILDLGDANNHEFTLNHTIEAQRDESYWSYSSKPEDWTRVKKVWDKRFKTSTNPQRRYECTMKWYFEGRAFIIEEHPSYRYWEKWIGQVDKVDSTEILPIQFHSYRQSVWPPLYTEVSAER